MSAIFPVTAAASTSLLTKLLTPADITTHRWYDASDTSTISHTSNVVSQWDDKSGNNGHLTAVGAPTTNIETENGLNAIGLDGVDDYFRSTTLPSSGMDYVIVYRSAVSPPTTQALLGGNGVLGAGTFVPLAQDTSTSTDPIRVNGINNPAGTSILFDGESSQSATNRDQAYDTLLASNILEAVNLPSFDTSSSDWRLGSGSFSAGGYFFGGKLCEVIIFPTSLTTRQQMVGYAARKWGFASSLDPAHPYKNFPPLAT